MFTSIEFPHIRTGFVRSCTMHIRVTQSLKVSMQKGNIRQMICSLQIMTLLNFLMVIFSLEVYCFCKAIKEDQGGRREDTTRETTEVCQPGPLFVQINNKVMIKKYIYILIQGYVEMLHRELILGFHIRSRSALQRKPQYCQFYNSSKLL